jgi:hypothetical protein
MLVILTTANWADVLAKNHLERGAMRVKRILKLEKVFLLGLSLEQNRLTKMGCGICATSGHVRDRP